MQGYYFLFMLIFLLSACKNPGASKETKLHTSDTMSTASTAHNNSSSSRTVMNIDSVCAIIYLPDSSNIEKLKREMGEENFFTVVDDNNFYNSQIIEALDSLKIEVVETSETDMNFRSNNHTIFFLEKRKLSNPWGAIFFNGKDTPKVMSISDALQFDYRTYYNMQ
jgi:hypothetical protein